MNKLCECNRTNINPLSGICDLCWNEKFPEENVNVNQTLQEYANVKYPSDGYENEIYCDVGELYREKFIEGAKYQAERMYSEDDMKIAFEQGEKQITECDANGSDKKCYCRNEIDCQYKRTIEFEEWFEQFKKDK